MEMQLKIAMQQQLESLFEGIPIPIEVINFGITATNTVHQLALLKAKVLDYKFEFVIQGVSPINIFVHSIRPI